MNPELTAAVAPILRDLAGADGVLPNLRDEEWYPDPKVASAFLYAADGSGAGSGSTVDSRP